MAFPPLWDFHSKKLWGYKPLSSLANIEDWIRGVKQGGEWLVIMVIKDPRKSAAFGNET
jgi:hypothetical protein